MDVEFCQRLSLHLLRESYGFYFFFYNVDSFSFSALTAVAKTSKTMLNSIGESGHPCLVPDFRENVYSFSLLRIMFAVVLSIYGFYYVEVVSFYACFMQDFYHKWMLNFVKGFFYIY